jgi:CheY-like chemotaxis protein
MLMQRPARRQRDLGPLAAEIMSRVPISVSLAPTPDNLPEAEARLREEARRSLEEILGVATDADSANRYPRAADMATDLEALASDLGVALGPAAVGAVVERLHAPIMASPTASTGAPTEPKRRSETETGPTRPTRVERVGTLARPKVLIVDDSELVRDMLCAALPRYGFEVAAVDTGNAALDWLAKDECDAIISDVQMPDLGGFELCTFVRSSPTLKHVAIVLLTNEHESTSAVAGFGVGADDYVRKGVSDAEIAARLHRLLRARER